MRNREIGESKSFLKALNNYFLYKEKSKQDKVHALMKYNRIIEKIIEISRLETFPGKKVNFRNSKGLQYFAFQKHVILFQLTNESLRLMYFIAEKRIKRSL